MVTINVRDHVTYAFSGDDGEIIYKLLLENMSKGEQVTLDFKGIASASSSFVNVALITLLDTFSFERIKELIRFTSTNEQINDMIRSRFMFEVQHRK